MDDRPIGVFDSGVGGLTVARALLDYLPGETIIYYGDTTRGPYGPLERGEGRGYVDDVAGLLVNEGVKVLVVACNCASSAGPDYIPGAYPDIALVRLVE